MADGRSTPCGLQCACSGGPHWGHGHSPFTPHLEPRLIAAGVSVRACVHVGYPSILVISRLLDNHDSIVLNNEPIG